MKKFFSFFLVFLLFLVSNISYLFASVPSAHAQTNDYNNISSYLPQTNADVPHNLITLTQGIVYGMVSTGFCFLIGYNPVQNSTCVGVDPDTGKLASVQSQQQHV